MTKRAKKRTHGGKRAGAGAKPIRGAAKVTTSIAITPDVKAYLDWHPCSQSEVVETALRDTSEFRAWLSAR